MNGPDGDKYHPLLAVSGVGYQNGDTWYYDNLIYRSDMMKVDSVVKDILEDAKENYDEETIRTEVSDRGWYREYDDNRNGKGSLWIPVN